MAHYWLVIVALLPFFFSGLVGGNSVVVADQCSGDGDGVGAAGTCAATVASYQSEIKQLTEQIAYLKRGLAAMPSSSSSSGNSGDTASATTAVAASERALSAQDVACAVITTKRYHGTRARAVRDTWAPLCGLTLFFSADAGEADGLSTVVLPGTEEGSIINEKVFGAFAHLHQRHLERFKWFIKADDDTFLAMRNVVALLASVSAEPTVEPHYVGRAGEFRGIRYCGGGAGYALSQAALRAVGPHLDRCERLPVGEDVSVGKCLAEHAGLAPSWRAGFYHKPPDFFLNTAQGRKDHPEGLSPRPVSFHSVLPGKMHELHYLLNTVTSDGGSVAVNPFFADSPWPETVATH